MKEWYLVVGLPFFGLACAYASAQTIEPRCLPADSRAAEIKDWLIEIGSSNDPYFVGVRSDLMMSPFDSTQVLQVLDEPTCIQVSDAADLERGAASPTGASVFVFRLGPNYLVLDPRDEARVSGWMDVVFLDQSLNWLNGILTYWVW